MASSTAELSRELHDPSAVVMSIDSFIQNVVEEQFSAALIRTKAKHIQGLVMDADTGEILAMAQSPGMNSANKKFDPLQAMKNHVTQDSYEPGSTFKPIVAALALQQKLLRADETMNCENGSYRIGKHTIGDVHPVGVVAFPEVLIRSSNICMAKVGMRLGKQRLHDGLATLGIGQRTGFELPGEARGIFRGANKWAEVDVATHSFGHGVSVTALQLTRAFSAVMNGGILVTPTILKRRVEARAASEVGVRVFDQSVSDTLREILVGVTEDEHGTGNNAAILGVKVAGKTGTAQKLRQGARGYDSSRVVASFIGFVDGRDLGIQRRLTMVVVVDEPGVMPRWGGAVAAPVFKLAMERIISHLMTDPRQSPAGPAEKRSA